uniref:BTB domain-containing protein n=1 Tax=Parastrongyloides trichosuri TaxID=131310 RepID=A0A0N4ZKQ4_PARTI
MEAKRRKLNDHPTSSGLDSWEDVLFSNDPEKVDKALAKLKKLLSKKERIIEILDDQREKAGVFYVLVRLMLNKSVSIDLVRNQVNLRILRETISIIANCCYFSITACMCLTKSAPNIMTIFQKLLNLPSQVDSVKAGILRLIGNIFESKKVFPTITSNLPLMEKLASFINSEDKKLQKHSIRIFKILCKNGISRRIIDCNGVSELALLIVSERFDCYCEDILFMITFLARTVPKDTGRQLATPECSNFLFNIILEHKNEEYKYEKWVEPICSFLNKSYEIRESIGRVGLTKFILEGQNCISFLRILTFFSQDAWGRVTLRENGGLDIMIERLQSSDSISEKIFLIQSLKNLIHDTVGISYLCQSRIFFDTVLTHVKAYIKANPLECKLELRDKNDCNIKMDCSPYYSNNSFMVNNQNYMMNTRAGYVLPYRGSRSPSGHSRSNSLSPTRSIFSSPERDILDFEFEEGDNLMETQESKELSQQQNNEQLVVFGEFFLMSWQTHDENNHKYLAKNDIIETWINYLSINLPFDSKAGRAIKRLARSSNIIPNLLKMKFYILILETLIRRPCMMHLLAKQCDKCSKIRAYGKDLYRDFSEHIDTDFGWNYILVDLKQSNDDMKINAMIASVALIRTVKRRRNYFETFKPIKKLIEKCKVILTNQVNFDKINTLGEYNKDILFEIMISFGTLISRNTFEKLFFLGDIIKDYEFYGENKKDNKDVVSCKVPSGKDRDKETICFQNLELNEEIFIEKEILCKHCEFYQAMFSTSFKEAKEKKLVFNFNEGVCDIVPWSDFKIFIHYCAGCSNEECIKIETPQIYISLLYLADFFNFDDLTNKLLQFGDPWQRMFSGTNLKYIIPLIRQCPHIFSKFSVFFYTNFLCYTTKTEMLEILSILVNNPDMTNEFMKELDNFLSSTFSTTSLTRGFLI